MLAWLRGERQWYDEAEQRHRPIRLVDYESPSANVLHVTWEWKLKPPARKGNRADVMFLVNGVPVAIVEHKNPTDPHAIDRGITQLRRYEMETPELLAAPQLFNVTHLLDYWYGVTWNASRRFMARWKERPEESYRSAVQSFFEPTDFLRTLRDWILFYVEDGETRKSVLRQHQRRAVDRIVERCSTPSKRRGLTWHTQGSGKTFTLLTAARLILERKDRFRSRHGGRGRGPDGARRTAPGLGGAAARRDAATGHRGVARGLQGRSPGVARDRQARPHRLHDPQVRGHREGRQHARRHLRVHRRGAPLGCQGSRHLPDGGGAQRHHHRIHGNPDRPDPPGRGHLQDLRLSTTSRAISTSTPSPSRSRTRRPSRSATPWRRAR